MCVMCGGHDCRDAYLDHDGPTRAELDREAAEDARKQRWHGFGAHTAATRPVPYSADDFAPRKGDRLAR